MHPKIVAERLGHRSTQITLDTYSHVMLQEDRAAMSWWPASIDPPRPEGPDRAENSLTDYLGLPDEFELRINLYYHPEGPAAELDEVWLVVIEPAERWGPPPGLEASVVRALRGSDDARPSVVGEPKRSA